MAGYDRYFYNMQSDDEYIPYKNTLSVTPLFEVKPFMLAINYSYLLWRCLRKQNNAELRFGT